MASGATAVQIAERRSGRDHVLEHLGSAHTDVQLGFGVHSLLAFLDRPEIAGSSRFVVNSRV